MTQQSDPKKWPQKFIPQIDPKKWGLEVKSKSDHQKWRKKYWVTFDT